ncbi:MAG TPA: PH domain-containing protein [Allosphingosinicella sp.]
MSAETVADRRVHPGTVLLRVIKAAPQTVIAAPAGIAFVSGGGLWRALGLAAILAAVGLFFHGLAWYRFRYGVGAEEIVIESGILHRNRRSIPFERVQDVDIERALLARIFGLAKVRIETGAGGKDEGLLDSVTVAEADRLRATVRAWRAGEGAAPAAMLEPGSAAAAPVEPQGRLLFAMGLPRVLLFGLFNFSLAFIAGAFAFLQTFDKVLPFDIYDPARWVGLVGDRLPHRFTAGAIAAVLVLALILGFIAGVIRTVSRDFGYKLSIEGDRFRRERGLLTRTEAVIAKGRIQLARLETGPIRRAAGWFGLSFQTLGAASDGSGSQVAAPFATRDELDPILAETRPLRLPQEAALTMVSNRHILRALLRNLAPPLAAILWVSAFWRPALFFLALLPLLALKAALERRFHRYALDGDMLFIARGVWRQRLWVIPVRNAQAISVARGWMQRLLGLASVAIDTAGAPASGAPRIVDVRLETALGLAAEIAAARAAYSSGRKSGTER